MSISSELLTLQNTKTAIRTAINNKGGSVGASDTFASYATAIDNLPSGGGNKLLTSIDVSDFTGTTFNMAASYITSVTIPSGVTSIYGSGSGGGLAFTNITSITIPDTVTYIGQRAFFACESLSSVTIPNNVTFIGYNAFSNCTSLKTVIIGSGVTEIKNQAFYNDTSLDYVICLATTPPALGTQVFNDDNYRVTYPIYVPSASVETYKAASGWSSYASRIYAIAQVATVDNTPVYNYDLGMTSTTMITSTNMQKMPAGTSLELAEGIIDAGGSFGNYTSITLPSTFTSFDDQGMIGNTTTTLTCLATTPPTAERNDIGGANLTAIYVPAANVADYQANAAWSSFSSIIQAIPSE